MKRFIFSSALFLICLSGMNNHASAQSWLDNLTLRKSFQSKNDKAEAASITFNKPKDTVGSWAVDAAIGYNVLSRVTKTTITLDPYLEFHKNTLVKKKQDSREAGLALQWQLCNLDNNGHGSSPILISALKYNQDRVKGNESFRGNIYITAFFETPADKNFLIPNKVVTFGHVFDFYYAPYIGLEYEDRLKTLTMAAKGHIWRWYGRINPVISLFPGIPDLQGKIELTADYQYRGDFSKTVTEIQSNRHEYFTAGASYAFFQNTAGTKSAKIGLDFVNGEDPTANFAQQSYYALSLKVKL